MRVMTEAWVAWTPEETADLARLFAISRPENIARALKKKTGVDRTPTAIQVKANKIGLDTSRSTGLYNVREAAEKVGVSVHVIYEAIERGVVEPIGKRKALFLRPSAIKKLRAIYPPPPRRWISRQEMMRRLGYGEAHACRLLINGAIKGVKRGGRWYVDALYVERMEQELLKSGAIRLDLKGCRGFDRERVRCKDYQRTRTANRRQARLTTWMTCNEAQRALGTTRKDLRARLAAGEIPGRIENDCWLVLRSYVEEVTA
jgi:hypothetical protein